MERKRIPLRIVLTVLLGLMLACRVTAVILNADEYWSFWKLDLGSSSGSLELLWTLPILILMLAFILLGQWLPFLALIVSIAAQWWKPPRDRDLYILCIAACITAFLAEGFLYFTTLFRSGGHVCEMPLMDLAAALINGAGILFVSGHNGRG